MNPVFSLDYYDIDIDDPIDEFAAQEVLDACYTLGLASECAKVIRVGGTLTLDGSGVELLTRNKVYLQAEGVELGFSFGFDVGMGDLHVLGHGQQVPDARVPEPRRSCRSSIATATSARAARTPRPEIALHPAHDLGLQRPVAVGAAGGTSGLVDVEPPEAADTYRRSSATSTPYDYIDLYASYRFADKYSLSFGAMNVTDEDPPVVGNEAASTDFNSGNTFPSVVRHCSARCTRCS